jgi:hypothetical protein
MFSTNAVGIVGNGTSADFFAVFICWDVESTFFRNTFSLRRHRYRLRTLPSQNRNVHSGRVRVRLRHATIRFQITN